jgi:5-methylcytosine-specific restriction endonuclease McrA
MLRRRSRHSAQYKAHLRSPEWARIRREALARAGHRCAMCGRRKAPGRPLQVHHNTYENLGHERPEDLTVLCAGRGGCHAKADAARRATTRHGSSGRRRRRGRRRHGEARKLLLNPIGFFLFVAGSLKIASVVLPHA